MDVPKIPSLEKRSMRVNFNETGKRSVPYIFNTNRMNFAKISVSKENKLQSKFWLNKVLIKNDGIQKDIKEKQTARLFEKELLKKKTIDLSRSSTFGEMNHEKDFPENIKTIDNWVFQNIAKLSFFHLTNQQLLEKFISKKDTQPVVPQIEINLLETIVREAFLCQSSSQTSRKRVYLDDKDSVEKLVQKIAVTSETINREYNKNIIIELIESKLKKDPYFGTYDKKNMVFVAKMLLADLISSFKVLESFKHLSLSQIQTIVTDSRNSMRKSVLLHDCGLKINLLSDPDVNLNSFEQSVWENFFAKMTQIEKRKTEVSNLAQQKNNLFKSQEELAREYQNKKDQISKFEKRIEFGRKTGKGLNVDDLSFLSNVNHLILKAKTDYQESKITQQNKIEDINKEIQTLEKEIFDLKFAKKLFKFKLIEIYFNLLSDVEQLLLSKKSVVSLITNLQILKTEVKKEQFCDYFSRQDYEFVVLYAKLMKDFRKMKADKNIKKVEIKSKFSHFYNTILNEKEYGKIDTIKKVIYTMKQNNLKVFLKKKPKKTEIDVQNSLWQEVPRNSVLPSVSSRKSIVMKEQFLVENQSEMNEHLTEFLNQISILKEKYIHSTIAFVREKNVSIENFQLAVQVKKKFSSIFGAIEASKIISDLRQTDILNVSPVGNDD